MKIAYYCDGLCECSDSVGCYRYMHPGMDWCRHTFDPEHALYGKCEDPENHPERFHLIDIRNNESCYWEGEVFSTSDLTFLNTQANKEEHHRNGVYKP